MTSTPAQDGGFLSRLGGLFGGGLGNVSLTPEQQLAEQRRTALFQAGLATLASAQQPGATFGGSLFSGFQAGANSLQQAQQNALQSKRIKQQEDQKDRLLKADLDRARLDEQKAAREARERSATAGQRFSTGVAKYKTNPLGYFNVVKGDPDLQAAAKQIGFDLSSVTTPEQVAALGEQLGAYGSIGADPARDSTNRFGPVNPGQFSPASVQRYAQTGNYADLEPYVPPAQPQIVNVGGVDNVVIPDRNGGPPQLQPLSTLGAEASAAGEIARFKKLGEQLGVSEAERQKRSIGALNTLDQLALADPLIDVATGSASGATRDKVVAFFGKATDGARAIGQLKVLQATLIQNMPRLEGPQSDRDVQLYKEAAGQIGDPTIPAEIKKDALAIIRTIQRKYAAQFAQPQQRQQSQLPIDQIQFPGQAQGQAGRPSLSDIFAE